MREPGVDMYGQADDADIPAMSVGCDRLLFARRGEGEAAKRKRVAAAVAGLSHSSAVESARALLHASHPPSERHDLRMRG